MIPKFIHHIWIGDKPFPSDYINFLTKWRLLYPDYNFIFWDNQLVESTDILSSDIEQYYYGDYNIGLKADLLRFKILEKFGGIYVDVDTEPLKRMPDEILNYNFFNYSCIEFFLNPNSMKCIALALIIKFPNKNNLISSNRYFYYFHLSVPPLFLVLDRHNIVDLSLWRDSCLHDKSLPSQFIQSIVVI